MEDYKEILIGKNCSLLQALKQINRYASYTRTVFVVDEEGFLLGALTDGDIRRALLDGTSLDERVEDQMNTNFISTTSAFPRNNAYEIMDDKLIDALPVVDDRNRVKQIILASELANLQNEKNNTALIVAGGLGQRLAPLTEDTPKPMLSVGGKPIIEGIIDRFSQQGFKNIVLSVNYRAEQIKEYFGDGKDRGIKISYLEEKERLGTAGSISLLDSGIDQPFVVCNGDLITKINFNTVLEWHIKHKSSATMCIKNFDYHVPYGVVESENHKISKLVEKPRQSYWVNAGVYILNPEVIKHIPKGYFDMTDLFNALLEKELNVCSFPIGDYWLDIGQKKDFERAQVDASETKITTP